MEEFRSQWAARCEVWHDEARDVGTRDVTRHTAASRGAWRGHVLRHNSVPASLQPQHNSGHGTSDHQGYLLLVTSEVRGWCRAVQLCSGQCAWEDRGLSEGLGKCHRPLLTSDVTFPAPSIQCFNKMIKWIFYYFLRWWHKKLDVTSEQRISTEKNGHSH